MKIIACFFMLVYDLSVVIRTWHVFCHFVQSWSYITQDKLANLPHHHFLSKAGNLYWINKHQCFQYTDLLFIFNAFSCFWTREKVGNDAIWLLSWYRVEYAALHTFLTLRNNYVEWYGHHHFLSKAGNLYWINKHQCFQYTDLLFIFNAFSCLRLCLEIIPGKRHMDLHCHL
jgi:hypothetical protein